MDWLTSLAARIMPLGAAVLSRGVGRLPAPAVSQFCCVASFSAVNSLGIFPSPFLAKASSGIQIKRWREFSSRRQKRGAEEGGTSPVLATQETSTSSSTSTLLVQEVEFVWKGQGSEVFLTGDFLKWETQLVVEKTPNDVFSLKQKLPVGKYLYKFIVDGEWKHSPDSPSVPDGTGGFNNELTVSDSMSTDPAKVVTDVSMAQLSNSAGQPVAVDPSNEIDSAKTQIDKAASLQQFSKAPPKEIPEPSSTDEKPVTATEPSNATDSAKAELDIAAPLQQLSKASSQKTPVPSSVEKPVAATDPSDATDSAKVEDDAAASLQQVSKVFPKKTPETITVEMLVTPTEPSNTNDSSNAEVDTAIPPKQVFKVPPKDTSKLTGTLERPVATNEPSNIIENAKSAAPAKRVPKTKVAKSLEETMLEDVIPLLTTTLSKEAGVSIIDISFEDNQLKTSFAKGNIPYCFWAFFPDGTLTGSRGSSLTARGAAPSTIEPFLIDEKNITPELVVFWIKKRLLVQEILSRN